MKVLDLFAGTRSISKAFENRGHESFSVELDTTRGLKGARARSVIPQGLCDYIVHICEV